jgi:hypothetical protein
MSETRVRFHSGDRVDPRALQIGNRERITAEMPSRLSSPIDPSGWIQVPFIAFDVPTTRQSFPLPEAATRAPEPPK